MEKDDVHTLGGYFIMLIAAFLADFVLYLPQLYAAFLFAFSGIGIWLYIEALSFDDHPNIAMPGLVVSSIFTVYLGFKLALATMTS
ncbi:hypothetical protein GOV11_00010 [Candidatus Woesearchaeota archaeon]|nr:hypothetical protein [Candidatus Woesearchaeota archaeon]